MEHTPQSNSARVRQCSVMNEYRYHDKDEAGAGRADPTATPTTWLPHRDPGHLHFPELLLGGLLQSPSAQYASGGHPSLT